MNHTIELKEGTIIVDGYSVGSVSYDGKCVKLHTSMDSFIKATHARVANVVSLEVCSNVLRARHDPDGKGYCDLVVDVDFVTEQEVIEFMHDAIDRLGVDVFYPVSMEAK